ncbi:transglycosylase SLT domain-containing protein [Pinirhizobacter sp.]|jgi:soluble lytic murein transglycosylase|uniref:transglycosylase SLT domain-containing protein n=1 Tax=Pinirhizobacter sp. TaxID=2950432 RepID=UPI002F4058C0
MAHRAAFVVALLLPLAVHADTIDGQRQQFRQAYLTARQGGDAWRAQATGLESYPIYPYLEAAALTHDMHQLDAGRVQSYLDRYPDFIPAADLRRDFLLELARRQDWNTFAAMYRPGLGDALTCDALLGRLSRGEKLDFQKDLASLWNKPSLPSACNGVLIAAHDQGLLTSERLWARIQAAADAGQPNSIGLMAGWLTPADTAEANAMALALRDPGSAASAASGWPVTPRYQQAAATAVQRLARRQSGQADAAWQTLQPRFAFSEQQRGAVLNALALYHATDFDEQALERLAALPPGAQSDSTREWRVRVALSRQDWSAALAALDALSTTQKEDGEWRYYRARVLEALNRHDEAQSIWRKLAQEPTFFGFLSADRVGASYAICPLQLATDTAREDALMAQPGLRRAFELYAVGMQREGRREWTKALAGNDVQTLRLAADLAYRNGWYDRAVFGLSSGDALRLYEQRFPLASQDGVVSQSQQAGVEPAWAYGIIRAESAWMSDARSGADARGLMQLLPGTASIVASKNGLPWAGGESLYDGPTNIQLGTRYLAQMAARYNGAPWLASAAYNAGPNKVDQWLGQRGSLPPDLFIASIPYKETREYVARVMAFSVIYDWRLNGSRVVSMQTRITPIGSTYALPTDGSAHKEVACPVVAVPARTASAMPAPAASTAPASSTSTSDVPASVKDRGT